MAIEKKFPASPTEDDLLKEMDRKGVADLKAKLLDWLRNFTPSMLVSTDVIEI